VAITMTRQTNTIVFCVPITERMKKRIPIFVLNLLWPVVWVSAVEISNDPLSCFTISEFAAINDKGFSTVVEGQETRSDWIEIHNSSQVSQNLDGWYLTDDPENLTLWMFPEVTIESHGNLIVWASGILAEDHPENWPYVDALGYYHTNFKLDLEGDYLALVGPDHQVVHEYAGYAIKKNGWGFPPQKEGVSYGLCGGEQAFLPMQTPGETNGSVCMDQCEEPVFSPSGGTFVNSFLLELNCPTANADIYYTLDGVETVPSRGRTTRSVETSSVATNWVKYTGPILINRSLEVMARAYEPNRLTSSIANRSYLALSSDVAFFSSNLPIVIVDTGGQYVESSEFALVKAAFIDTDVSGRAHITDPADFVGRGGLRIRGSSSSGFAKKQYAFETWDLDEEDMDVSIWGFPEESDWILYGPSQFDRAIISNALAYELSNQAGRYAVRTRFCEMYLNSDDGTVSASDYIGLCIFMEKITRDPERVDVEKLEPWDSTEPRISGGYVLSIDRPGDGSFATNLGSRFNHVYPKGEDVTDKQAAWITGYFNALETALYGPEFMDAQTGYAQYMDVNSFIDHHLLNLLPLNVDAFRLSGYMHKRREGKLDLGPIWDFDRALNSTDSRDDRPDSWSGNGGTDFLTYYWWGRLFEDPYFWRQYIDRWFELRRSVFSMENLNATIDRMAEEVREAQARDTQRWPQYGPRYGGFDGEIAALKDWLRTRSTWIDSQFIQPPMFSHTSDPPESDLLVTLDNPNGSGALYYTLDGSDPWVFEEPAELIPFTVLVQESSPKHVFVPTAPISDAWKGTDSFDDSMWQLVPRGAGGVGYEYEGRRPAVDTEYGRLISLDLETQMFGTATSCYIRIPFIISGDTSIYKEVTLQIRYDDGFVAYLNGVEVARAGFTGDAAWDSHADSDHDSSAAINLESFDVSAYSDLLIDGQNILAIHGLNDSATSTDFLILVQLIARERPAHAPLVTLPGTFEYTGPITLTHSTVITSRVRQAQHPYSSWGGLARQVFSIDPVAENLRISEIMYHPADTGSPMDSYAEYIELTNIGDQAINLNQVRFTKGIDFLFPDVELAPNDYVLVVKDADAFAFTYDTTYAVVVGSYTGRLSNGGERIELIDAAGQVIQSFKYNDTWYDLTDGLGFSLTLIDPADPHAIDGSDKTLWRPSIRPGGSPGWNDSGD